MANNKGGGEGDVGGGKFEAIKPAGKVESEGAAAKGSNEVFAMPEKAKGGADEAKDKGADKATEAAPVGDAVAKKAAEVEALKTPEATAKWGTDQVDKELKAKEKTDPAGHAAIKEFSKGYGESLAGAEETKALMKERQGVDPKEIELSKRVGQQAAGVWQKAFEKN